MALRRSSCSMDMVRKCKHTVLLALSLKGVLWEEKPYSVYLYTSFTPEQQAAREAIRRSDLHEHACECETSTMLAVEGETVSGKGGG